MAICISLAEYVKGPEKRCNPETSSVLLSRRNPAGFEQGQKIAGHHQEEPGNGGDIPGIAFEKGGQDQGHDRYDHDGIGGLVRTNGADEGQIAVKGDDGAENRKVYEGTHIGKRGRKGEFLSHDQGHEGEQDGPVSHAEGIGLDDGNLVFRVPGRGDIAEGGQQHADKTHEQTEKAFVGEVKGLYFRHEDEGDADDAQDGARHHFLFNGRAEEKGAVGDV